MKESSQCILVVVNQVKSEVFTSKNIYIGFLYNAQFASSKFKIHPLKTEQKLIIDFKLAYLSYFPFPLSSKKG